MVVDLVHRIKAEKQYLIISLPYAGRHGVKG